MDQHEYKPAPDGMCIDCGMGVNAIMPRHSNSHMQMSVDPATDIFLKRTFSAAQRKEMADKGVAMPDGSFPIPDLAALKAAVHLFNTGHGDTPAAKAHIRKRAKALGQPDPFTDDTKKEAGYPIWKSAAEERYTLAPVYSPDSIDAHGEFTTPPEIQKAFWNYAAMTGADRTIHIQHTSIPAGKWVELMTWPEEVITKSIIPGSEPVSHTLAAGTTYMGIVWEPWAWDMIKEGKLKGLSMGGRAKRVEVEFI